MKTFLAGHHVTATEFYPIVRARLTQINGQAAENNKDEALNRELNLTGAASGRIIIRWWPEAGRRKPGRSRLKRGWRSGWASSPAIA